MLYGGMGYPYTFGGSVGGASPAFGGFVAPGFGW